MNDFDHMNAALDEFLTAALPLLRQAESLMKYFKTAPPFKTPALSAEQDALLRYYLAKEESDR